MGWGLGLGLGSALSLYHALVKRQVKQIIIFKTSTSSALKYDSACHLSVCLLYAFCGLLRSSQILQLFSPSWEYFFCFSSRSAFMYVLTHRDLLVLAYLYKCWHNKSSEYVIYTNSLGQVKSKEYYYRGFTFTISKFSK